MASSESQARLTQTEPAKWIVVYKNGDQHFAGRRMVVKPREIKTFDSLLEEVTLKLSPSFGAVRNIFTPEGGTRVSSLTDLKPNGKYVASPNEPFRQLSRTRYGELPVQSTSTSHSHVSLQPVKDKQVGSTGGRRHHGVPSRYRDSGSDELTIHVFRNGDAFSAASAVRVDRLARTHWQQTLERLGEKLRIGRGVHKLYNLKGQLVRDPAADLEHNGLYVAAADNESFRLVNYGAAREPFRSVTRGDRSQSELSLPRIPATSRRARQKPAAGGDRSRSRGVSLPPAVPTSRSRASLRRQSSTGARERRRTAAEREEDRREQEERREEEEERREEEEDREREEDTREEEEERREEEEEEDGEREERPGVRVDSAYGSDAASPPVNRFRLTESEYLKPKETPREVVRVDLDSDAGGIYRHHSTSEEQADEPPEAPDLDTEVPLDLRPATQVNEELIVTH
ncbi:doublecortin domain-containing protein 2-like isoform X3 [Amphibalanus amphitrite]|uniref:doublecortin domain-containing protein 2-like isoform X3 n=1 Tax=Amphibalanus amphitrite TaxID=1232801 RepID=UPI001C9264F0|nr:doublecortin domain-containing protein 2-like isoform X3 [Amphibalanus amphitrite]